MMKALGSLFIVICLLSFTKNAAQFRQHRFRRQAYLQGNTNFNDPGSVSLESVFIFENDFGTPDTWYLPNNDLSVGINENLQLSMGFNFIYNRSAGYGLQPMDFSFKYNIFDEDEKIPQIDFMGKIQSQGIGSQKLSLGKTLPSFMFYATKNYSKKFHAVLDAGMQWMDAGQPASFAADFSGEYQLKNDNTVNFEINEYSRYKKFLNIILGVGATHKVNNDFTLEFNCGKYLEKINQNYYISAGFNKVLYKRKKKEDATTPATP